MTHNQYVVKPTPEERQELEAITSKGKVAAKKLKRAYVLLKPTFSRFFRQTED